MSLIWSMPKVAEIDCGKPPSIWWCALAYVVIQLASIVITVLSWDQGKPVMSGEFAFRALVVPLFVWGIVCGLIYVEYEERYTRAEWWNFFCRAARAEHRRWAQAHAVIVASQTLAPEPELAERLLGLEGSPPVNPGKVLALSLGDAHVGVSRMEQALEKLITPLAERITRFASTRSFEVVLRSGQEHDISDLRWIWQKLELPDRVQMVWQPLHQTATEVERWFKDGWNSDFRLVLACQLHAEDTTTAYSEAVVAMLMAWPRVAATLKGKLKPQALLFMPVVTPSDAAVDTLQTLLDTEQTPRARIRHLWSGGLTRQGSHAVAGAIQDVGMDLPVHDVDSAIGKPGPVNGLLLQALAAQMVEHGQGTQLLASPSSQGVMLNLIGMHPAPVPDAARGNVGVFSVSSFVSMTCCFFVLVFLLVAAKASMVWIWVCIISALFGPLLLMLISRHRFNLLLEEFGEHL